MSMAKTGIGVRPENRCVAQKKAGGRCGASKAVLKTVDGDVVRYKVCMGHLIKFGRREQIVERHGFDPHAAKPGAGRPRKPSAVELLRYKVEEELGMDRVLEPYVRGLEATRFVVVGNGSAAYTEEVSDVELSMKATDRILDRVYGKARQAMELTGQGGGPITIDVPTDEERAAQVAKMLAMAGGLNGPVEEPASNGASSNGHRNGNS